MQMNEMKLNLGPAKGKDFATSIGPFISTRNELKKYCIPSDNGERYDIELSCCVNGQQMSLDNLKNMTWTFAQIIERVSYGTMIYPGDIIGSGTCGTGCLMELNYGKENAEWLKDGDKIEITGTELGTLKNIIKLRS